MEHLQTEKWVTERTCPACENNRLEFVHLSYNDSQQFELFVHSCSNCGYKETSFLDSVGKEPVTYRVFVRSRDDLSTLFYKSPTAEVSIPELGINHKPMSNSLPRITTIEGFLEDVLGLAKTLGTEEEASTSIGAIELALRGLVPLTFCLCDDLGSSWVKPREGTKVSVSHRRPK
ncbi:MAG: hypothetical protein QW767_02190 [Thermoprotei archaeon]